MAVSHDLRSQGNLLVGPVGYEPAKWRVQQPPSLRVLESWLFYPSLVFRLDQYITANPLFVQVVNLTVTAQEFHVVIEKGEDGYYVANVVELPGYHTQARELNELDNRVKEAITVYLEAEGENLTVPEFVALKKIRI